MMSEASSPAVVAVALGFTAWEPEFVSVLGHPSLGVSVARRCFDCVDLLAFVATSSVDVVVVSTQLPQIDAAVIAELRARGTAIVLLTEDIDGQLALAGVGADVVLFLSPQHTTASARAVAKVVRELTAVSRSQQALTSEPDHAASGNFLSIWGPPGSTGRSTVAISLADELARVGRSCALVDADPIAPSLDQLLGVVDGTGSLDWALRHAAHGDLTRRTLLAHMPMTRTGVRLLLSSSSGSSLRPHLWSRVCEELQTSVETTVCDLGVLDTAPGGGVEALAGEPAATAVMDTIRRSRIRIVVGSADPVGLARLLRHLAAVREAQLLTDARCIVVVSRVSLDDDVTGRFIEDHLAPRVVELGAHLLALDEDPYACRTAQARACTIAEVAPKSRLRRELQHLAELVAA